jgi:hypothetical protein
MLPFSFSRSFSVAKNSSAVPVDQLYKAISDALLAEKARNIEQRNDAISFQLGYWGRSLHVNYSLMNSITEGTVSLQEQNNSILVSYKAFYWQMLLICAPVVIFVSAMFALKTPMGYYSIITVPAAFAALFLLQVYIGILTLETTIKASLQRHLNEKRA